MSWQKKLFSSDNKLAAKFLKFIITIVFFLKNIFLDLNHSGVLEFSFLRVLKKCISFLQLQAKRLTWKMKLILQCILTWNRNFFEAKSTVFCVPRAFISFFKYVSFLMREYNVSVSIVLLMHRLYLKVVCFLDLCYT